MSPVSDPLTETHAQAPTLTEVKQSMVLTSSFSKWLVQSRLKRRGANVLEVPWLFSTLWSTSPTVCKAYISGTKWKRTGKGYVKESRSGCRGVNGWTKSEGRRTTERNRILIVSRRKRSMGMQVCGKSEIV